MGNQAPEIAIKEHDGNSETKGKKSFMYGWDYINLVPTKVGVDSTGKLKVELG